MGDYIKEASERMSLHQFRSFILSLLSKYTAARTFTSMSNTAANKAGNLNICFLPASNMEYTFLLAKHFRFLLMKTMFANKTQRVMLSLWRWKTVTERLKLRVFLNLSQEEFE